MTLSSIDVATPKAHQVQCIDTLAGLSRLADGSVDLTVTSPPYNIGKSYENRRPVDEYLDWCAQWMAQIYRVTKPNGAFWLNLGYLEVPGQGRAVPIPYLLWNRSPFYLLQEVVWHYGAGVTSKRAFCPRNEKWLWFVKNPEDYRFNLDAVRDPNVKYPNQKKNGKLKCNPLGKTYEKPGIPRASVRTSAAEQAYAQGYASGGKLGFAGKRFAERRGGHREHADPRNVRGERRRDGHLRSAARWQRPQAPQGRAVARSRLAASTDAPLRRAKRGVGGGANRPAAEAQPLQRRAARAQHPGVDEDSHDAGEASRRCRSISRTSPRARMPPRPRPRSCPMRRAPRRARSTRS